MRSRDRRSEPSPLALLVALWCALAAHFLFFFAGPMLVAFLLMLLGMPLRAGGEEGLEGAGGDTLEISVLATLASRAAAPGATPASATEPAASDPAPAPPSASPARPEGDVVAVRIRDEEEARARRERARERRRVREERREQDRAERERRRVEEERADQELADEQRAEREEDVPEHPTEPDTVATAPGPEALDSVAIPGADHASSGRARGPDAAAIILGSVGLGSGTGETNAMLDALTCADPIAGTWVAHHYYPAGHDWARMTLRIERDGDRLTGSITSRSWNGSSSERRPPPCRAGGQDVTVLMSASGSIHGERIDFAGADYHVTRVDCSPTGFFWYNNDHFSGRIDPLRDEIRAVNNDGGRDVDTPYRFRRVSCDIAD